MLLALNCAASAQVASPVGLWKTYSDRTGEAAGLVRITEENGEFIGRVEKVLAPPPPGATGEPRCRKCQGDSKDQPIVGMVILRGVRRGVDALTEGEVLDPEEGKAYRCQLTVRESGRRLEVYGFILRPWLGLGRTQVWNRVDER